jgi:hypothetical protein
MERKTKIRNPRVHFYLLVYNISPKALCRLGGLKYLDSLDEDARRVLINEYHRYKVRNDEGRRITRLAA